MAGVHVTHCLCLIAVWSLLQFTEGKDLAETSEFEVALGESPLPLPQSSATGSCKCAGTSCGCCQTLSVLKEKKTVCINVKYLKKNIGVLLTVTWDGKTVFSKEVSVRNPPAICLNVPLLKKLAKLCVQLYNIDVGKDGLSGCSRITIKVAFIKVIKLDLGCFRIPFAENEIEGKELADLSQLLRKYEAGERPLSVPMMYLIKVFRVQFKPLS
uniref:Uncharacterized protein LOC111136604 n=1 Tax=Crassostrea virginica TaxID=6565 RepID=A0A8B8ETN9_CRAVI|nr:uncharacterized protein LOC111136604 [Crassostrea virginica]